MHGALEQLLGAAACSPAPHSQANQMISLSGVEGRMLKGKPLRFHGPHT